MQRTEESKRKGRKEKRIRTDKKAAERKDGETESKTLAKTKNFSLNLL